MEGAPHSSRENGFGYGLTDDTAWAAKFKQPVGMAAPAAAPSASANGSPKSWKDTLADVTNTAVKGSDVNVTKKPEPTPTPAVAMPASGERARFGDMGSVMESRVPGWGTLTPAERRAKLEAMPSPASRGLAVGQETGRQWNGTPGNVSGVSKEWLTAQGGRANFTSRYGTASVATPERLLAERTQTAPMRAEGSAKPVTVSGNPDVDPKVAFLRARTGKQYGHQAPQWQGSEQMREMKGDTPAPVATPGQGVPVVGTLPTGERVAMPARTGSRGLRISDVDPVEALRRRIQSVVPRRQDKRVATN